MKGKIENLLKLDYSALDPFLQSHIFNYICVLESGFLEKELQDMIDTYKTTAHCNRHDCKKQIESMKKIQNAKWCSIRPTLANIDSGILEKLKSEFADFEQITGSIDNMVNTRHKVAHGNNVTTLTLQILKDDFNNIVQFTDKLRTIMDSL